MKIRPAVLVLAAVVALLPTATIQALATNPPYLSQLPPTTRVRAEIKCTNAMDTAARQMGVFWQLQQLIKTLGGPRS